MRSATGSTSPHREVGRNNISERQLPKGDGSFSQQPHFVGDVSTRTLVDNSLRGQELIKCVVLKLVSIITA